VGIDTSPRPPSLGESPPYSTGKGGLPEDPPLREATYENQLPPAVEASPKVHGPHMPVRGSTGDIRQTVQVLSQSGSTRGSPRSITSPLGCGGLVFLVFFMSFLSGLWMTTTQERGVGSVWVYRKGPSRRPPSAETRKPSLSQGRVRITFRFWTRFGWGCPGGTDPPAKLCRRF